MGSGGTGRRVALVLLLYVLAAWAALPVLGSVRRLLLLPELFTTLGRWLLVAGLPVALLTAWRYPDVDRDDP